MDLLPFTQNTHRLTLAGLKNENASGSPVIALHGWLDNAASFLPLADYMSLERPFYALDLPGHGLSEHRPASAQYHLVDNVVDILAFIEAIGAPSKVTLIGHSMGGIVCTLLAASRPDLVDRLLLLDSLGPLTDSLEQVLPQLRKAVKKAGLFKRSSLTVYPDADKAARVRMTGVGRVSMEAARLLVSRGLKPVEGGYSWTSDPRLMEPSLVRFSEQQVETIYRGIECPVRLICGNAGYFSDYKSLAKRLQYIPQLDKHLVEGGHHFHMDGDVKKTAELIDEFI